MSYSECLSRENMVVTKRDPDNSHLENNISNFPYQDNKISFYNRISIISIILTNTAVEFFSFLSSLTAIKRIIDKRVKLNSYVPSNTKYQKNEILVELY